MRKRVLFIVLAVIAVLGLIAGMLTGTPHARAAPSLDEKVREGQPVTGSRSAQLSAAA